MTGLNDTIIMKLVNSTNSIADHMSKQTDTFLWVSIIGAVSGFAIYFFILYQPMRIQFEYLIKTRSILNKIAKVLIEIRDELQYRKKKDLITIMPECR